MNQTAPLTYLDLFCFSGVRPVTTLRRQKPQIACDCVVRGKPKQHTRHTYMTSITDSNKATECSFVARINARLGSPTWSDCGCFTPFDGVSHSDPIAIHHLPTLPAGEQ